jgi:hypothetical protein
MIIFVLFLKKEFKISWQWFQNSFVKRKKGKIVLTSFLSLDLAQLAYSLALPAGPRARHLGPAQRRSKP